ncbi:hypothetical protein SAMN03159422_05268 [Agrobacterium fabrum]|nr:hypothetical protein SAMN03159422_05268 [Agrobacterium fabrum]SES24269.1 hypothetical protein SAMN03159504_05255 [Agrobacterium fabrum]
MSYLFQRLVYGTARPRLSGYRGSNAHLLSLTVADRSSSSRYESPSDISPIIRAGAKAGSRARRRGRGSAFDCIGPRQSPEESPVVDCTAYVLYREPERCGCCFEPSVARAPCLDFRLAGVNASFACIIEPGQAIAIASVATGSVLNGPLAIPQFELASLQPRRNVQKLFGIGSGFLGGRADESLCGF